MKTLSLKRQKFVLKNGEHYRFSLFCIPIVITILFSSVLFAEEKDEKGFRWEKWFGLGIWGDASYKRTNFMLKESGAGRYNSVSGWTEMRLSFTPLNAFKRLASTTYLVEQKAGEFYEKEKCDIETFEELAQLPAEVKFPEDLIDKIRYEPLKQHLIFKGVMSEREMDKLLKLSGNKQYRNAIKILFKWSKEKAWKKAWKKGWDKAIEDKGKNAIHEKLVELIIPNPYFKSTFAASGAAGTTSFTVEGFPFHLKGRIAQENFIVWGFGADNRFIGKIDDLFLGGYLSEGKFRDCLRAFRFYGEYLDLHWWARSWWQSDWDWRAGVDFWYEWNVPGAATWGRWTTAHEEDVFENFLRNPDRFIWAELWLDSSYKKTNFFLPDYESWGSGLAGKMGIRSWDLNKSNWLPLVNKLHVMPYASLSASVSGKDFSWENQMLAGGGLRVNTEFKVGKREYFLLKFYAEHIRLVEHFKDEPVRGGPEDDTRVGISFSIARR